MDGWKAGWTGGWLARTSVASIERQTGRVNEHSTLSWRMQQHAGMKHEGLAAAWRKSEAVSQGGRARGLIGPSSATGRIRAGLAWSLPRWLAGYTVSTGSSTLDEAERSGTPNQRPP